MTSEFVRSLTETKNAISDEIDRKVLAFFGSEQEFLRLGHLFVIEQEPVRMEVESAQGMDGLIFRYQATVNMRIRPKTLKELEAEQHD